MVRKLIVLILLLPLLSCAGYMTEAPIFKYGAYLRACEYHKYSVCCNYRDDSTMCSARYCNSVWQQDWELVFEMCPGDGRKQELIPTDERL